ncbi:MAG: hypothetical protein AABX70_05760 [Nanoarchaeota archaeon]
MDIFFIEMPALLGRLSRFNYDFGSAHYNFSIRNHLSEESLLPLTSLIGLPHSELKKRVRPAKAIIQGMLKKECDRAIPEDQIIARHDTTRGALDWLLKERVGFLQKVALPVPNWHFWSMAENRRSAYKFAYFNATKEEELVEGFRKIAQNRGIKVLLLVDPANPLMYQHSEEGCKEIDRIALNRGIDIVIDDVLRGTRPLEDRRSIARYFTNPYVVEGFGKRFGDDPLGGISYVLIPEKTKLPKAHTKDLCPCGEMLQVALDNASVAAVAELEERNRAFDRGLRTAIPNIEIERPFASSLISLVYLPEGFQTTPEGFMLNSLMNGVKLRVPDGCFPEGHKTKPNLRPSIRITVGQMNSDLIEKGAEYLGRGINYNLDP